MENSPPSPDTPRLSGGDYEPTDVHIGGVLIFVGILVAVIIVVHFVIGKMYRDFSRNLEQTNKERALRKVIPSVAASRSYFPFPREQSSPQADLDVLRQHEDEELHSYGWIDRKAGIVRIPIDQAMDLLLQKGLPTRSSTNANATGPSSLQLQQLRPLQSEPAKGQNKP